MDWNLLAAFDGPDFMEKGAHFRGVAKGDSGGAWVIGSILFLVVLLMLGIWAFYRFKNRTKHRSKSRKRGRSSQKEAVSHARVPIKGERKKSDKRRNVRRNPTIAEAGGLPPKRDGMTLPDSS